METINLIIVIAFLMCPAVLFSTMELCFLYRGVPLEYRSPLLFLLFFMAENYLQIGGMTMLFSDMAILLTSVLVTSNFLVKLM